MPTLQLTSAERSALRSQAHSLHPVVMIGADGLTPAVFKETDLALRAHGLIKVRVFGDDRSARLTILEQLCTELDAAPIQHIGKLLVLWRPQAEVQTKPASRPTTSTKTRRTGASIEKTTDKRVVSRQQDPRKGTPKGRLVNPAESRPRRNKPLPAWETEGDRFESNKRPARPSKYASTDDFAKPARPTRTRATEKTAQGGYQGSRMNASFTTSGKRISRTSQTSRQTSSRGASTKPATTVRTGRRTSR